MYRINRLKKQRLMFVSAVFAVLLLIISVRLIYLQIFKAQLYQKPAYEQQTRDRLIKAQRGDITDRNGKSLAITQSTVAVSVVHNQIQDESETAQKLSEVLELNYEEVLKKVQKRVALERIQTKVDKEKADKLREMNIAGVKLDEDVERIYPFDSLASKVIGFVGKDNQGVIGLESKYDSYLKGKQGKIMTETDARGRELKGGDEQRIAPVDGLNLVTTIDINIQKFAEQTIEKAIKAKSAKKGAIIVMNPQNGEIYAMAVKPDFNLNEPFEIENYEGNKNEALNQMWRNFAISDTYEPGSTFKVITSTAGLEENVVKPTDSFNCSGGKTVGGRYIKCWRSPRSHGTESFVQGVQNSCNPVFMEVAERLGAERFYKYIDLFEFNKKTGIDVSGEAVGIFHKLEKVGPVELATMSFGQSFQITPLQLLRAISCVINGGTMVTPHFAIRVDDKEGKTVKEFEFPKTENVISKQTSDTMREILESVVETGTGNKAYIPGYRIGGKTATSEKLPRKQGKYIASFMAFAPSENPQMIAIVIIDEPQGVYYGGQVAGPVMKELVSNVLPYLGIKPQYNENEQKTDESKSIVIEDYTGKGISEARTDAEKKGLVCIVSGEGKVVKSQFPKEGETVNNKSRIFFYTADE